MKQLLVLALLLSATTVFGQDTTDQKAVKKVIVSAYVEGLHQNRDADAGRAGFHPDFIMHVNRDGELVKVTPDQWFSRLSGEKNEHTMTHEFAYVDVTENVASAKILMYEDDTHIFTDYMGLYRFEDGWRIVNKVFQSHRK